MLTIAAAAFLCACSNSIGKHSNQPANQEKAAIVRQSPLKMEAVRGQRYCEILAVSGGIGNMTATVYNTLGCNDCPEAVWKNINAEKIKKELNARRIVMNGPRVFLMDSIGQFNMPPPKVNLGGIAMVERARLAIDLKTFLKGKRKAYEEQAIDRSTKFVFNKGSYAYFLHHGSENYIMQSFSQIVNPVLYEEGLKTLAGSLKLPNGWTYEVKKLETPLILESKEDGKAYVIQDDFQNTYQKIVK